MHDSSLLKLVNETEAPHASYMHGKLKLVKPQKPLKGRGYERLHWRMDGIVIQGANESKNLEKGLQKWFLSLLDGNHHIYMDSSHWITQEAWQAFVNHENFWRVEWQRFKAEDQIKKENANKVKKAKIRQQTEIKKRREAKIANMAGLTPEVLHEKCVRVKALIQSKHHALAGQVIYAAEPWLLKVLLNGCSTKSSSHDLNAFFEETRDSAGSFLFWLAAAVAYKSGCCPVKIDLKQVPILELTASNLTEFQWIVVDILPLLTGLKQLCLNLGAYEASTADLPVLRNLTRLILRGNENFETNLIVESIERQSSLLSLVVERLGHLNICDNAQNIWDKVRIETGGRTSLTNSGLVSLRRPPEADLGCAWVGCHSVNNNALIAFLYMQQDWAQCGTKPIWWRPHWNKPDVRANVTGKIIDIEWPKDEENSENYCIKIENHQGVSHNHACPLGHSISVPRFSRVAAHQILALREQRELNLIGWRKLSVDQARLIAGSNASLRIESNLLSRDVILALRQFRGELRVEGHIEDELLIELIQIVFSTLELEFERFGPMTLKPLADFKGGCLVLRVGQKLEASDAKYLSKCAAKLILKGYDWPIIHLDSQAAAIFCHGQCMLQLDASLHLTEDSIQKLKTNPKINLVNHHQTCCRINKKGVSRVTILRLYDPDAHKKELIRRIQLNPSGVKKISDERFHYPPLMEAVVSRYLERGYTLECKHHRQSLDEACDLGSSSPSPKSAPPSPSSPS